VPPWARDVGRWSWIIVGVSIVVLVLALLAAATRLLVFATLFAVLFGATFLPVADWLARHRVPRWLAALLVLVGLLVLAVVITLVIVYGLVNQVPTIQETLDDAAATIEDALNSTDFPESTVDSVKSALSSLMQELASGAAGAISSVVSAVGSLLFGIFIAINIMVWVLIQGRKIGAWVSHHLSPIPQPVAYEILAGSARFFRGYIWGSTIVGLFNAAVLGLGAVVIGVPMAGTIAIVAWLTNYIPYFGAIMSGAFAVLLALGAGGTSKAIPMLILVIIANGFLQTVISQFALGSALDLHPLAVLFATTAGGIAFGAVGGVFAAPFLKIGLDAYRRMKEAGLFGAVTPDAAVAGAPGDTAPTALADGPPGPDV
jgi:predicted PurR-regulated permease PerM